MMASAQETIVSFLIEKQEMLQEIFPEDLLKKEKKLSCDLTKYLKKFKHF